MKNKKLLLIVLLLSVACEPVITMNVSVEAGNAPTVIFEVVGPDTKVISAQLPPCSQEGDWNEIVAVCGGDEFLDNIQDPGEYFSVLNWENKDKEFCLLNVWRPAPDTEPMTIFMILGIGGENPRWAGATGSITGPPDNKKH